MQSLLTKPSFSPFLAKPLKASDFAYASYCQKYQMIVACSNRALVFYDATTLLPLEGRKSRQLEASISSMSYYQETETYIFVCGYQFIYIYNVASDELKKVKEVEGCIIAVEFVNSRSYAFVIIGSTDLYLGTLEKEEMFLYYWKNKEFRDLHFLQKSKLLLSTLENGNMIIYCMKRSPQLQMICSIQAYQRRDSVNCIQSAIINGKEYVITATEDKTLKIWHLRRGIMKLLKVIQTKETVKSLVSVENYKLIATADELGKFQFFSLPSGKLEKTLSLGKGIDRLFFIKEKSCIGGIGRSGNRYDSIEFIQLLTTQGK